MPGTSLTGPLLAPPPSSKRVHPYRRIVISGLNHWRNASCVGGVHERLNGFGLWEGGRCARPLLDGLKTAADESETDHHLGHSRM